MLLGIGDLTAREAFGRFVKRRRDRLGWSQRDLEHVTGVDQTVISRIENGRLRNVRLHQIAPLLCTLAPKFLEIRPTYDGTFRELPNWEAVRPFAPPVLIPPHLPAAVRTPVEPAPAPPRDPDRWWPRADPPRRRHPAIPLPGSRQVPRPRASAATRTPMRQVKAVLGTSMPDRAASQGAANRPNTNDAGQGIALAEDAASAKRAEHA